jgi:hypothetical protein
MVSARSGECIVGIKSVRAGQLLNKVWRDVHAVIILGESMISHFFILDCPDSLYFKFERSMASAATSNKKIHQKMYAPCTFAGKTIMAKKNLCHSSQKRPMTQNQKEKNELVF